MDDRNEDKSEHSAHSDSVSWHFMSCNDKPENYEYK